MSTEILVNIGQQETRVALVEGGAAQEICTRVMGKVKVVWSSRTAG